MMLASFAILQVLVEVSASAPTNNGPPPIPYYGSTVDPTVASLTEGCDIPTDSVAAVSPRQYDALTSNVRLLYNLSNWLQEKSLSYYNKVSCFTLSETIQSYLIR